MEEYKGLKVWSIGNGQVMQLGLSPIIGALDCMHDPKAILIEEDKVQTFEKQSYCSWTESDKSATLHAQAGQVGTGGDSAFMIEQENIMDEEKNYVVRRLTPDECALLQGYPIDWCNIGDWTDTKGKVHNDSDTAKYKAYGNSIALPQWQWIIDRMADYLPKDAKVGSLFDGIGGFPLCWERTHGKGTARWASEIEEFPIAVTKIHFPEEG